jgi:hypothetical protein
MKIGDIVKIKKPDDFTDNPSNTGIILRIFEKKCWRTRKLGHAVDWDLIEQEPHAEVMINENILNIPLADLEKINEDR